MEIMLYKVQSEDNVGSIYRLAYQFRASKIYSYMSAEPGRTNTRKTEKHIPVEKIDCLDFLDNYQLTTIALETKGKYTKPKLDNNHEFLICVGNESYGIPTELLTRFDYVYSIKSSVANSYNVSHALAIALYQFEFN